MSEDERITVGAVSAGGEGAVDLPVVELLTGRGFVTGKSGSGKSNTASVVAEKLLDGGYGLLIVDIDGEYYGLKEEYEILHVGADEECDIQVGPQHAEKIAQLALEKHVPIILDVSSFLDESKANELLTEVARHLFAKEKKLKRPFLLVVEEVHEYLPEGGGLDECGRMLIKVAKRGRKHGLGMCGISQRPADVKKDFITQCDWLVWHRLTWQNDTKVVSRILGSDYADGVEELNDGEGYLMTDWDEGVRQVQFQRKRTFDAGATPGLDDFERPELKSVSDDLVSDLERITEDQQARQSRVTELERELKDRELRIEELESELEEARDLSRMAEQFSRAMMAHATGRPFREDVTGYQASLEESSRAAPREGHPPAATGGKAAEDTGAAWDAIDLPDDVEDGTASSEPEEAAVGSEDEGEEATPPDEHARPRPEADGSMTGGDESAFEPAYEPWPEEDDLLSAHESAEVDAVVDESSGEASGESALGTVTSGAGDDAAAEAEADGGADMLVAGDEGEADDGPEERDDSFEEGDAGDGIIVPGETTDGTETEGAPPERDDDVDADAGSGDDEPDTAGPGTGGDIIVPGETDGARSGAANAGDGSAPDGEESAPNAGPEEGEATDEDDDIIVHGETETGPPSGDESEDEATDEDDDDGTSAGTRERGDSVDAAGTERDAGGEPEPVTGGGGPDERGRSGDPAASFAERDDPEFERPVVGEIRETIDSLDPVARGMLAYYRAEGPASPVDAQVAAGGDGDRTRAYGRNRELREAGLVAHAGRGTYAYALRSRIDDAHDGRLDPSALAAAVERVEAAFLDRSDAPWPGV
jgi:TolA-binding protein